MSAIQRDALPIGLTLTFDRGPAIGDDFQVADNWRGDLTTLRRTVPGYIRGRCEAMVCFYEAELDKAIEEERLDANPLLRAALILHDSHKRGKGAGR